VGYNIKFEAIEAHTIDEIAQFFLVMHSESPREDYRAGFLIAMVFGGVVQLFLMG
jgi:hypothetical protein